MVSQLQLTTSFSSSFSSLLSLPPFQLTAGCYHILPPGVPYGSRNVLEDMEVRQGVKDYTQWPTIPQVRRRAAFLSLSFSLSLLFIHSRSSYLLLILLFLLFSLGGHLNQIFIGGEFVGGCDILMDMHKNGELEEMLKGES